MWVTTEIRPYWSRDGEWEEWKYDRAVAVSSVDDGDQLVRVKYQGLEVVVDGPELIAAIEKAIGLAGVRRGARRAT